MAGLFYNILVVVPKDKDGNEFEVESSMAGLFYNILVVVVV